MRNKQRAKTEKPAIKNFITETDLKREMENTIETQKATIASYSLMSDIDRADIISLNELIEQKDAIIVTMSLELSELKGKYTKQSQRLGGYVQSNKNYKEKNKLQVLHICDLGITINSLKERCKCQQTDISGLKIDVEAAETHYELQYRKNKDLASQLKEIRSKWWFWLFN